MASQLIYLTVVLAATLIGLWRPQDENELVVQPKWRTVKGMSTLAMANYSIQDSMSVVHNAAQITCLPYLPILRRC